MYSCSLRGFVLYLSPCAMIYRGFAIDVSTFFVLIQSAQVPFCFNQKCADGKNYMEQWLSSLQKL